jgi:hypothetical protein
MLSCMSLYHPWNHLSTYCPGDFTHLPFSYRSRVPYMFQHNCSSFTQFLMSMHLCRHLSCTRPHTISLLIPKAAARATNTISWPCAIVVKFFYLWNWTVFILFYSITRSSIHFKVYARPTYTLKVKNYRYFHTCPTKSNNHPLLLSRDTNSILAQGPRYFFSTRHIHTHTFLYCSYY